MLESKSKITTKKVKELKVGDKVVYEKDGALEVAAIFSIREERNSLIISSEKENVELTFFNLEDSVEILIS